MSRDFQSMHDASSRGRPRARAYARGRRRAGLTGRFLGGEQRRGEEFLHRLRRGVGLLVVRDGGAKLDA